jgi:hypothetical protein
VEIRPEPFRVEGFEGQLRREPGRLAGTVQELRLPASASRGTIEVTWGDQDGVRVQVEGESEGLALADLQWLEPRLPDGVARGAFELDQNREGLLLRFLDTGLALSDGRIQARGGLLLGPRLRLRDLDLSLEDVDVAVLDPWLPRPTLLRGKLTGDLRLDGDPAGLGISGDVALVRPDSTLGTDATVAGTFHFGDPLGVTDFVATMAPLEWGILKDLSPSLALEGPGALRLEADGSLPQGITLYAEATHVPAGMTPSRVILRGTVQGERENPFLNLGGELSPLSVTSVRRFFPALPLTGEVSGPVTIRGDLSDLTMAMELLTAGGPLGLEAHLAVRDRPELLSVESRFQEFLLSALVPALPSPTRLTGQVTASGGGTSLDSLRGEVRFLLRRGTVGAIRVDTASLVARVEDGLLHLDALMAETNVGVGRAEGTFGMVSGSAPGVVDLEVESESLEGLRPILMGEIPVVLDELNSFERGLLVMAGADLDTIPTSEEVALGGRLSARARFMGGLERFSAEGDVRVDDLRYRTDYLQGGTLTFSFRDLPGEGARVQGLLVADSLSVRDFSFRGGEVEADLGRTGGGVRILARRREGDAYRARGTFDLDSLGGRVNLDELDLRFDSVRWNLGGPASFAWSPEGVQVRDFRLIRPGAGRLRVFANGFLPFRGEGEFDLEIQELSLGRLARIVQREDSLEGTANLWLTLRGTAEDPALEGRLSGEGLRFGPFSLDGLDSEFTYRGRRLEGEAWASVGGRQVLAMEGFLPADLRIRPDGPRVPPEPMDLTVAVDSFPAALALVVVEALEEVDGALSGQVRLAGTPAELAPTGAVRLTGGSAHLPAVGVRFRDLNAIFSLNPDGTVEVDGTLRSRGRARVVGTVNLHPIRNPGLDLTVTATDFLAVARRDVRARVSGEIQVLRSYQRPRVEGSLTVEEGVLMVEELARSVDVVDLADPMLIDVVEPETSLRPIVQASQNPFLQNLMLAVDLSMARGSWLRGRDLNVEMDGEVQVFWDRTERDLALVGELGAVRGYYTVLGRQFQIQGGDVSFQGTPGVNPRLNIEALHRLRTPDGERLDIVASVGGTLLDPRVSLSSSASVGIAESDLVSYLIFGRPTYALASGQSSIAQGAAGSLLGAAGGATANLALGTVGSQLGAVVARDFGLDFLAISQGGYLDPSPGSRGWERLGGTVSTTQVEIGQYVTDDVFAALMWRPLYQFDPASRSAFAGFRVEWRLADDWTLEGFLEDRFLRSALFLSGEAGYQLKKVFGLSFWREWGY